MDKTTWISFLSPLITVAFAIWLKRILPSLILGLLVGSFELNPSLIRDIEAAMENNKIILADKNNLNGSTEK